MSERLPSDTIMLLGTRRSSGIGELPIGHSSVISFNREQLADCENRLCGFRGDWVVLFEEVDLRTLNEVIRPMLLATPPEELAKRQRAIERGEPVGESLEPVIYYADSLKRMSP